MSQNKLYVGNLSFATDDDALGKLFAEFGQVQRAQIVTDRDTGRSRGFGFVEMDSDASAQKAVSALDGSMDEGRKLVVNIARPREDRGGGGGPRRDGGGGGRRGGNRW
jgi:RNA recognition motif-containing protein